MREKRAHTGEEEGKEGTDRRRGGKRGAPKREEREKRSTQTGR